ncbi:MAG: Uma2 family endonuclease, partial [Armatimonadetes bacterium]|nr:Uma2 family endonuclease [Anaerolineae bacterium]
IALPENQDRLWELIDRKLQAKILTEEHSLIASNIFGALRDFVRPRDLGRLLFEARHQLPGDDHNARLPDVEFTHKERLQPVVREGGIPQMPDLAVEVKSKNETYKGLRKKALYYLENGTQVVWLVYPAKQQVEIWTDSDPVRAVGIGGMVDCGEVLPGFTLPVSEIFAE